MRQRGCAPERDGIIDPVERRRTDVSHFDHDLHVVGTESIELLSLVGADEHVERARHHRERRAQFGSRGQGIRHCDRDDHVGTGLARDVHRDVARESTVPEDSAVDAHGREHAGHCHARPQRERQVAAIEDNHLAALHVRGHRTEWNGQPVEFRDAAAASHEVLDRQVDVLRVDQAGRRDKATVTDAKFQTVAVGVARELAPHRHLRAQSAAANGLLPGDRSDCGLDFVRAHTRSVRAADDRTHARADDAIDWNAQFVEHAQNAYVRRAFRATAAEHESDARARLRRRRHGSALGRLRQGRERDAGNIRTQENRGEPAYRPVAVHAFSRHRLSTCCQAKCPRSYATAQQPDATT